VGKNFAAMDKRGTGEARDALRARYRDSVPTSAGLDQLAPNPLNPRYEDDPEVQETAESFRQVGQLQAAVVVPRDVYLAEFPGCAETIDPAAEWVVVIGNRRLVAARLAGLRTLDIRVSTDLKDAETIDAAILHENLHRKDLPPLLEAKHLKRMVDRPGGSIRKIAERIGKSHMYVQQRLSLLKLIPELQDALKDGGLSIKEARQIFSLDANEQHLIWEAGPPYNSSAVNRVSSLNEQPAAPAEHQKGVNPVYTPPNQQPPGEPAADASPTHDGVNPVYTHPSPPAEFEAIDSANGDKNPTSVLNEQPAAPATQQEGVNPVYTPPQTITVPIHSTAKLAEVIRHHLTVEEISHLVRLLAADDVTASP
jgi:ParB/RepB/Spo0J family partition protein